MNVEEQAQKITLINNINAMCRTIGISEHDFDWLNSKPLAYLRGEQDTTIGAYNKAVNNTKVGSYEN